MLVLSDRPVLTDHAMHAQLTEIRQSFQLDPQLPLGLPSNCASCLIAWALTDIDPEVKVADTFIDVSAELAPVVCDYFGHRIEPIDETGRRYCVWLRANVVGWLARFDDTAGALVLGL